MIKMLMGGSRNRGLGDATLAQKRGGLYGKAVGMAQEPLAPTGQAATMPYLPMEMGQPMSGSLRPPQFTQPQMQPQMQPQGVAQMQPQGMAQGMPQGMPPNTQQVKQATPNRSIIRMIGQPPAQGSGGLYDSIGAMMYGAPTQQGGQNAQMPQWMQQSAPTMYRNGGSM
jgi:hypothetical protein